MNIGIVPFDRFTRQEAKIRIFPQWKHLLRIGDRETRADVTSKKQRGCSRISSYLNSGITRFSICARYSRVKLETMPIGSPSSMEWGVHSKGTGCLRSQKVSVE